MTNREAGPPRIELRGVRVHNLQNIDLDLPLGRLIVITGVSGAGKSSLAFDTLYAEGQRRYVESFSTYARRFLERFEKPDADRIEPIPPAVAVRQKGSGRSRRATVGTATEIYDSLRLLFARVGVIECAACRRRVERHTPASAHTVLAALEPPTRFMVCFALSTRQASTPAPAEQPRRLVPDAATRRSQLIEAGFTRIIVGGRTVTLSATDASLIANAGALVVVDRLAAGASSGERLADSLEIAFRHGDGACVVLVQHDGGGGQPQKSEAESPTHSASDRRVVDGVAYDVLAFNSQLICSGCGTEFVQPEPALFNFNSPLGACPQCRGTGEIAMEPAAEKSPADCPSCRGARLRPEALAVQVAGRTITDFTRLTATELLRVTGTPETLGAHAEQQRHIAAQIIAQATARLEFLIDVGLGYLTLDRPARSLSGGEAQRVRLTAAFGSKFVNMLYVLDEPTSGLHPRDTERLLAAIGRLRDAGNTVVVVEHDATLIRHADQVIDIGPGAGREGGRVVFQGTPPELLHREQSTTADFFSGRRQVAVSASSGRRSPAGWLRLAGVEHHNLHGVTVEFPLGVLCVVSGVSGSGKSSLVQETLYPAVVEGLRQRSATGDEPSATTSSAEIAPRLLRSSRGAAAPRALAHNIGRSSALTGFDQIDDVLLIDQSPIGRSARANPASFLNLFGEIRTLFAGTAEAKVKNFSTRHFSFNSAGGGRCETCRGAGTIAVDMQFLPDVVTTCPDCHGTRYRREILEARYRGLSIADVLALTVRDAFLFFRGRTRLQRRLKVLKDVGLDYITLGQAADTLSGGESQRLKLAALLSRAGRARTLFIVDEPTTGLHPADIARLLDSLGQLLAGGHSLIVIEHNLDFIRAADYVIDLGPGAGPEGGEIVATGTPEEISRVSESVTGRFLA